MTTDTTAAQKSVLESVARLGQATFTPSQIARASRTSRRTVEEIIPLLGSIIILGAMGDTEQHYFVRDPTGLRAYIDNLD